MQSLFGATFKTDVLIPFVRALETQVSDIRAGLQEGGDPDQARRQAHTVKGSAGNLGFVALSALGAAAERSVKEGELDGARAGLTDLQAEFLLVEAMIEKMG